MDEQQDLIIARTQDTNAARHLLAQKKRGESRLKWFVLADVFCSWTSAYFLTFCVAALETTLLDLFNWDSVYFSYIVASTFLGAIVGPFLLPFFEGFRNKVALCTLANNQILLIIGQVSFALFLQAYHAHAHSAFYILMLASRFVIGLGMGSTDALCQGTINLWFGASDSINEAFGILCVGSEIGVLTSRTAFLPFYNLFNDSANSDAISLPFLIALVVPTGAILVSVFVNRKLARARRIFPEYFVSDAPESVASESVSVAKEIVGLSGTVWLVIAVVVLVNVVINVLYGSFVDPLHETFALSEYEADLLLSLCAVSIIIVECVSDLSRLV